MPQFSHLVPECKEILHGVKKILESVIAKVGTEREPPVLVETKIIEDLEPEPEMEGPLIGTHVVLSQSLPLSYCHFHQLRVSLIPEVF